MARELEPRTNGRRPGVGGAAGRLARIAAGAARVVRTYALVAAAAAAVIAIYLFRDGVPEETDETVLRAIFALAAFVPPAILLLFAFGLKALAELPAKIRGIPGEAGERVDELTRALGDARGTRGGLRGMPRLLWRLSRLSASSRELLTPYASVVPLFRLASIGVAGAAAAIAALEILAAPILLLALATG